MVLLLLTLGSLLLEGLNLQQRALLAQTASETQAIRDTAIAHSALQWGKQQAWSAQRRWPAGSRRRRAGAPVCASSATVHCCSAAPAARCRSGSPARCAAGRCVFPPTAGAIFARSGRRAYVKCPEAPAGFSLPETVLAMALMVLTVTALGGYQRGMAQGIVQLNQTRQLWRDAWRYSQLSAPPRRHAGR
jgi:prepilin peptidase dependent protein C